jgi:antitoxin ChpS
MHVVSIRKVGGSLMLALPPALLDVLDLRVGAKVGVTVENGRLVAEPRRQPSYTLDELLAQCDPDAPLSPEDREWVDGPPAGGEII